MKSLDNNGGRVFLYRFDNLIEALSHHILHTYFILIIILDLHHYCEAILKKRIRVFPVL